MNFLRRFLAGGLALALASSCAAQLPLLSTVGGPVRGDADGMDLGHPGGGTIRGGAIPSGPAGMRIQAAAVDPGQVDHYVYKLIRVPGSDSVAGTDALTAALYEVTDVVVDAQGNLIMADTGNHRVRMLCKTSGSYFGMPMTAGQLYTIAGSDSAAAPMQGEGETGTATALRRPQGLALDALGNLYIADTDHHRIRLLCKTAGSYFGVQALPGRIYTIAGTGGAGISGNANGNGGPAQSALFQRPVGLAFDAAGHLYIADSGNNQVRTVASAGGSAYLGINYGDPVAAGYVYAVAGTGAASTIPLAASSAGDGGLAGNARLDKPTYLAFDAAGDLYLADTGHHRIRAVSRANHQIRHVAGSSSGNTEGNGADGATTATASLRSPTKIAIWRGPSNAEHLLIADSGNHCVRLAGTSAGDTLAGVTTGAGTVRHLIGSGAGEAGATANLLHQPVGLAVDGATLYVADRNNHRLLTVAGQSGTPAVGAAHGSGVVVATSPDTKSTAYSFTSVPPGTYVLEVDAHNAAHGSLVQGGPKTSTATVTLAATGSVPLAQSNLLVQLPLLDGTGGEVLVSLGNTAFGLPVGNHASSLVRDGKVVTAYAPAGNPFNYFGLANANYTVWAYAHDGAGKATPARSSQSFTSSGGVVAANPAPISIPALLSTFGPAANAQLGDGGPAVSAELNTPQDVIKHPGGLIIAETASDRVRMLCTVDGIYFGVAMTAGRIYTIAHGAAPAQLRQPKGLAIDGTDLYIADAGNQRVRKLDAAGAVSSVIGSNFLTDPTALAFDSARNLYIADPGRRQVLIRSQVNNTRFGMALTAGTNYVLVGSAGDPVLQPMSDAPHSVGVLGDGGAAAAARTEATGLALSPEGHLILAEPKLNRLRIVAQADDADYFGRTLTEGRIYHLAGDGSTSQPGLTNGGLDTVRFKAPERVFCDFSDGTLLVADAGNDALRILPKISGSRFGHALTANLTATLAGGTAGYQDGAAGTARFSRPGGLAIDPLDGSLYVADAYNGRLRAIATTGSVMTAAGDGWSFSLPLGAVNDVAVDTVGNLYVADAGHHVVRMICRVAGTYYGRAMEAGKSYRVAGVPGVAGFADGLPGISLLNTPSGLTVHQDVLYVADTGNHRLRVQARSASTVAGNVSVAANVLGTIAGTGVGTSVDAINSLQGTLNQPIDVVVDSRGNAIVAEAAGNRIRVVVKSPAAGELLYDRPAKAGQLVTLANATGLVGLQNDGDKAYSAGLNAPSSLAIDGNDWLYVMDRGNNRLRIMPAQSGMLYGRPMRLGHIYSEALTGDGIAVDPGGNVYVADAGANLVRMLARATGATYVVAGGGAGGDEGRAVDGQVLAPTALVMDIQAMAGRLSILSNGRVREVY